jgi:hypothetical protein
MAGYPPYFLCMHMHLAGKGYGSLTDFVAVVAKAYAYLCARCLISPMHAGNRAPLWLPACLLTETTVTHTPSCMGLPVQDV